MAVGVSIVGTRGGLVDVEHGFKVEHMVRMALQLVETVGSHAPFRKPGRSVFLHTLVRVPVYMA